ncbi:MAG: putative transcriptional regulator, TetR family [Microbacteriaceae bacterium]|nr:putative transcriptional regulator, TetR family [Microbacteriaceae bacterium]
MSGNVLPRRAGRPGADTADLPTDEEIIRRGLSSFAELGYEGTSVRELSRRLGVSHNFVNDRYGSKEKFWKMLIDTVGWTVVEPLRDVLSVPYDDELERFTDGVRIFLRAASANADLTRIITEESGSGGPRLEYVYERHVEPIVQMIKPAYDRLVAEGRVRDVPFGVMMFAVLAMTGVSSRQGLLALLGADADADSLGDSLSQIVLEGLILQRLP